MGFYAPAQLVGDARDHGVPVRPVDVNHSDWDCTLSPTRQRGMTDGWHALRLGFRLMKGFPEAAARAIMAARPFRSIHDLARRAGLSRPLLARLAAADALRSLGWNRREALWQVLALGDELPLFAALEEPDPPPPLTPLGEAAEIVTDYDNLGLSLRAHPISLIRSDLDARHVLTAAAVNGLKNKVFIQTAGLVLMRQRPATAKGTIFVTLEDETGTVNLVVWARVWERYRRIAADAVALLAAGTVETSGTVVHVVVKSLENVAHYLRGLTAKSRDFR
jgi:error-prone DNA polymerase